MAVRKRVTAEITVWTRKGDDVEADAKTYTGVFPPGPQDNFRLRLLGRWLLEEDKLLKERAEALQEGRVSIDITAEKDMQLPDAVVGENRLARELVDTLKTIRPATPAPTEG